MKRTRRVSVEIEHREISISLTLIEPLASVFQQIGLHPPIFAGGMFLVCRQSFDQLREQL
jgi:hypothetical protein